MSDILQMLIDEEGFREKPCLGEWLAELPTVVSSWDSSFESDSFRKRRSSFNWPTMVDASAHKPWGDSIGFCNLTPRSSVCTQTNDRSVKCLLERIRPSAIAWLIALFVVNSVNGEVVSVPVGSSPCHEWLERMPLITDGDSDPAVVLRKSNGIRVDAPGLHQLPDSVKPGIGHSVGRSRTLDSAGFASCAAAISQVSTNQGLFSSAIASAQPECSAFWLVPGLSYDGPLTESEAGHIDDSRIWIAHFQDHQ